MRPLLPLLMTVLLVCGGGPVVNRSSGDRIVQVAQLTSADPNARPATPRPVVLAWEPTPVPTPTPAPATARPAAKPAVTAKTKAAARPKATPRPVTRAAKPRATAKPVTRATPAPTPKPVRATPKPGPAYDREDVKARIRASWPGDDDKAIRVVDCETAGTFNPRMTSYNGKYYGLWQFDSETWQRNGGSGDPRDHTPEEQTRVAWKLFEARGWAPWPTCGQK